MTEKYDFSTAADQEKFRALPSDEQEKIIEEAEDEAGKIKEMIDQGRAIDYARADNQLEARKHWQNGHLGVTAKDHLAFGGSPNLELTRNPGKTLGELWNLDKIREKLEELVVFLEKSRQEYAKKNPRDFDAHWPKDNILYAKKELRKTISYLMSIEKLPKEFENFEVRDLETDPKE